ncbi:MAG: suppressor of fused domain protein [Bryobacterales bacterium]|nr:suppressor of fused domain protein [Acidobacteriota bacterium]MCB9384771.1 suppressor of fused domain protein [Bryobacterales bacterium]
MSQDERDPQGQINRHGDPRGQPDVGPESAAHLEKLTEHVERHVGPVETVLHEVASDYVHIDLLWAPPNERHPFHTFVTSGMSDRPMNVEPGLEEFRLAELFICLPPSWPISPEAFQDERNWWPLRLVKTLARLPHVYETWLGPYHSSPNGDPAEPYAPGTKLCGSMLFGPIALPMELAAITVDEDTTINLYSVLPLHDDEMGFKLREGGEALIEKMSTIDNFNEVVNPKRASCVRKKWKFW